MNTKNRIALIAGAVCGTLSLFGVGLVITTGIELMIAVPVAFFLIGFTVFERYRDKQGSRIAR